MTFGKHLKALRENQGLSLRKLASSVNLTASYLSQVESDSTKPPSEETLKRMATVLGVSQDIFLAAAGRVSDDLRRIIMKRPELVGDLLRQIDEMPDDAVLRVVREVRDGKW